MLLTTKVREWHPQGFKYSRGYIVSILDCIPPHFGAIVVTLSTTIVHVKPTVLNLFNKINAKPFTRKFQSQHKTKEGVLYLSKLLGPQNVWERHSS